MVQTSEAFKLSKGEFITFLDDDEYLPEKLEKQLELILSLSDEYGFIYGAMADYENKTIVLHTSCRNRTMQRNTSNSSC